MVSSINCSQRREVSAGTWFILKGNPALPLSSVLLLSTHCPAKLHLIKVYLSLPGLQLLISIQPELAQVVLSPLIYWIVLETENGVVMLPLKGSIP